MPLTLLDAARDTPTLWTNAMLADFSREPLYHIRRIPETNVLNRVLVKLHLKRPNTELVWRDVDFTVIFPRDKF
jgi:hypothetical protein